VIADPPLLEGPVHDTTADTLPPTPVTPVGCPGTVRGVTTADAAETEPVPRAFVAVTENVYAVPFDRPVTVHCNGPELHTHCAPPGDAVTVNAVIVDAPSSTGAVQDTTDDPFATVPVTALGAPGGVGWGVTEPDAADAELVPAAFVAVTENVYAVPFDRPVTVHCNGPELHTHCAPPGDAVTVYPVTTEPPSLPGAAHDTTDDAFATVPKTPDGAPGTVRGVTEADAADAELVPAAFVAVTENVYAVPFDRPVTVHCNGPELHTHCAPPGDAVTVYPVTTEPPSSAGASHDTTDDVLADVPETADGGSGNVAENVKTRAVPLSSPPWSLYGDPTAAWVPSGDSATP
jgi:hypothetical protein